MYAKKLELSVDNLNEKLTKLKTQHQKLKSENASLKASNDNHIFINEKLNKALQKLLLKNKQLSENQNQSQPQKAEGPSLEERVQARQKRRQERQKKSGKGNRQMENQEPVLEKSAQDLQDLVLGSETNQNQMVDGKTNMDIQNIAS